MTTCDKSQASASCIVCQSADLLGIDGFDALPRITSDCRAFPAGGELFVCGECGMVQKQPTADWMREIGVIYSNYASYYQSGGDEQIVFDKSTGRPRRRSDVLMERLSAGGYLPAKGSELDVGCGNGVTLASMNAKFPEWSLSGYELGDSTLPNLSRIPRFESLYTKSLTTISRTFDFVTMIHSLEHFPVPKDALDSLASIVGDGRLFIEVCNVEQNPFDILVADHLAHFSPASLSHLLNKAGFEVLDVSTDWVPKEVSLIARKSENPGSSGAVPPGSSGKDVSRRISNYVRWLHGMADIAHELARGGKPLGIFGTSIAATWLGSQLEGSISFFVDEDESRVGKIHLGRPIVRPAGVPVGSVVYLALAPVIAKHISDKLSALQLDFVLPPSLDTN